MNSSNALEPVKYLLQDTTYCHQNTPQRTYHPLKNLSWDLRKKRFYQQNIPVAENVNSQYYSGQIGSIATIHSYQTSILYICIYVSSIKNAVTLPHR
jgi:hypothetical protein